MFGRGIFKKQVRRTLRRPNRTYTQGQFQVAEYTTTSKAIIHVVYSYLPGAIEPFVISAIRLGMLNGAFQRAEVGTHHDPSLDLAYTAFLSGKITETIEVGNGIYCDFNREGEVMGVEIFNYSLYEDKVDGHAPSVLKRLPSI